MMKRFWKSLSLVSAQLSIKMPLSLLLTMTTVVPIKGKVFTEVLPLSLTRCLFKVATHNIIIYKLLCYSTRIRWYLSLALLSVQKAKNRQCQTKAPISQTARHLNHRMCTWCNSLLTNDKKWNSHIATLLLDVNRLYILLNLIFEITRSKN